jgi:hypothetical protein
MKRHHLSGFSTSILLCLVGNSGCNQRYKEEIARLRVEAEIHQEEALKARVEAETLRLELSAARIELRKTEESLDAVKKTLAGDLLSTKKQ